MFHMLATVVVPSLQLACAVLVLPLREALSHSLGGIDEQVRAV